VLGAGESEDRQWLLMAIGLISELMRKL
jgi:hypothetical protein